MPVQPLRKKKKVAKPADATDNSNNPRFGRWLFTLGRKYFGVAFSLSLVPLISEIAKSHMDFPPALTQFLPTAVMGIHALVIGIFIIFGLDNHKRIVTAIACVPKSARSDLALRATKQFCKCWQWLWLSWLALYLLWFVEGAIAAKAASPTLPEAKLVAAHPITSLLDDLAINITNVVLVMVYLVVAKKTVEARSESVRDDDLPWHVWAAVFGIIMALDVVICWTAPEPYAIAMKWVIGVAGGVLLAMFVGRLEAGLSAPALVTVALYSYAVIQAAYPELGRNDVVKMSLTSIALVFKAVLFLFVTWAIQTGRLVNYMYRAREILDHGEKLERDFLNALHKKTSQEKERRPADVRASTSVWKDQGKPDAKVYKNGVAHSQFP